MDNLILDYFNCYNITENDVIKLKRKIMETSIEDLTNKKIIVNEYIQGQLMQIGTAENYAIFVLYDDGYTTDFIVCFPIVDIMIVKDGFKIKKIIRKIENLA